jgi:hypothetical protein
MSELREILKEEYIKQMQNLDLRTLLEMIEDVLDSPVKIIKEEETPKIDIKKKTESQQLQVLLNLIPDIAVSELGWSDVTTTDRGEIIDKGPQRRLLEGYLSNVKGGSLKEKIAKVSSFYSDGIGLIEQEAGSDRTKTIVQAISYLVFYKTLTKVITNFNASSAGFSFESFLAVLSDGYQIQANTGTIADYIDKSEKKGMIPVSLKLYREGGLEVGGSWKDLVNDLTMEGGATKKWAGSFPYAMRYVVCTKTLEGDDLEQEGNIHFYQFDFTLDNVMNILVRSGDKSRKCIMLPAEIVNAVTKGVTTGMENYMNDRLPSQSNLPSPEELEKVFINGIKDSKKFTGFRRRLAADKIVISEEQIQEFLTALKFAKDDEIFLPANPATYGGGSEVGVVRGQSKLDMSKDSKINKILELLKWPATLRKQSGYKALQSFKNAIIAGNNAVIASVGATKQKDKRKAELNRMVGANQFLSPEESQRQYNMLGVQQKRMCLLNSLGVLRTYKFHVSQTQVLALGEDAKFEDLGSIEIGRKKVAEMLGRSIDLLNKEVGQIFQALADLSESLNMFFAGLDGNVAGHANSAVTNAKSISRRDILQKKTDPENAEQLSLFEGKESK